MKEQSFCFSFYDTTSEDNDYAYALLPNTDKEARRNFIDEIPIKIKRHDQFAHLVVQKDEKSTVANV